MGTKEAYTSLEVFFEKQRQSLAYSYSYSAVGGRFRAGLQHGNQARTRGQRLFSRGAD